MKFEDSDINIVTLDDERTALISTKATVEFDQCETCGALMGDAELHARWHEVAR